ncbi:MAG: hypothetical protein ACLGQX_08775 [Acidobacteriota bacterium]
MSTSAMSSALDYTYVTSPRPSPCRILSWDIPSPYLPVAAERGGGGHAFCLHALPPSLTLYAFLDLESEAASV